MPCRQRPHRVCFQFLAGRADHERFDAKVSVLMENVRHHVEEEEQDLFPAVAKAFGKERLKELGEAMAEAKKAAPTRPHPRSPDEPPMNVVAGAGAAMIDRAMDAGRKLVEETTRQARNKANGSRRPRRPAGSRR